MLYNPDDKNKGKKEEKLLHADDDNKNLTDDVKANENSLFGKPSGNSKDHGHDSLFDSSFDEDDFVGSSFAVSFKANDPGNVSDMVKEDNTPPIQPGAPLEFEDDLADFEFDSSVSAFKPLDQGKAPAHIPAPEHTPANKVVKPEEPKPAQPVKAEPEKDPFEGIDDVTPPKFNDEDEEFMNFAGMTKSDDKLFNSGDDLDYATSSKDKASSPFAHSDKPEAVKPEDIDIPPVTKVEEKSAPIQSYGTVNSGVNAFKKKDTPKEQPVKNSPFRKEPKPEPKEEIKEEPKQEPKKESKPEVKPEPAKKEPVKNEPTKQDKKDVQDVKKEEPKKEEGRPAAAAPVVVPVPVPAPEQPAPEANVNPFKPKPSSSLPDTPNTRPAARPTAQRPIISENKTEVPAKAVRPGAADRSEIDGETDRPKSKSKTSPAIEPVSQVPNKKTRREPKAKKDPGKGGIITLVIVIAVFIGVFLVLDNADKISALFGGDKPINTVETSGSAASSSKATESSATSATTTEATTTTTTEATTTTTTEATTTTTTEATTTTTEATTTTTEATTATTTQSSGKGVRVSRLKTRITNFKNSAKGFKFDVIIKNNTKKDASLSASLKNLKINLYSSAKIKNLTSNGFTFSHNGNTYICKPIDRTIPSGSTVTIRVNVTTASKPVHFGYNSAKFNWK